MIARRREALQAWADFIKLRKNTSGFHARDRSRRLRQRRFDYKNPRILYAGFSGAMKA
jgi:hypothetical protein